MTKISKEEFERIANLCENDDLADVLCEQDQQKMQAAAEPDCPMCDGTGIFYGNVTICGCTLEV